MSTNTELITRARQYVGDITSPGAQVVIDLADALEAAEAELERSALPSKDTLDRCLCTAYSQDAGGGYFESLVEQEPACPVHSEYVFDPKVAAWVHRESLVGVRERTVTDAHLDRFETTAEPIYRSTVEAAKASKFLVSTLAQWVMRLTAEVRSLGAVPVSLEAVKAETTAPPAFVDSVPNDGRYEYTTSSDCDGSNPYYRARVPARHAEAGPWFPITAEEYAAASQNWGPEWRPVSTEGDNRG